jgi:hypothetical protein
VEALDGEGRSLLRTGSAVTVQGAAMTGCCGCDDGYFFLEMFL